MPIYFLKAPDSYLCHRILDSQGRITPYLSQQREKLAAEEIEVIEQINYQNVCLEKYLSKHTAIY